MLRFPPHFYSTKFLFISPFYMSNNLARRCLHPPTPALYSHRLISFVLFSLSFSLSSPCAVIWYLCRTGGGSGPARAHYARGLSFLDLLAGLNRLTGSWARAVICDSWKWTSAKEELSSCLTQVGKSFQFLHSGIGFYLNWFWKRPAVFLCRLSVSRMSLPFERNAALSI